MMVKISKRMLSTGKKLSFSLLTAVTLASVGMSGVMTLAAPANNASANVDESLRVKGSKGIYKETIIYTDARNGKKVATKVLTGLHDGDTIFIESEVPEGWAYDYNEDDYAKYYDKNYAINGGIATGNYFTIQGTSKDGYVANGNKTWGGLILPIKPSDVLGIIKVDYPAKYGIQIWTKDGKPVRYNAVEAKKTGHKVGDFKKLKGQSRWKVFGSVHNSNNTCFLNLGGDQYIDSSYTQMLKYYPGN